MLKLEDVNFIYEQKDVDSIDEKSIELFKDICSQEGIELYRFADKVYANSEDEIVKYFLVKDEEELTHKTNALVAESMEEYKQVQDINSSNVVLEAFSFGKAVKIGILVGIGLGAIYLIYRLVTIRNKFKKAGEEFLKNLEKIDPYDTIKKNSPKDIIKKVKENTDIEIRDEQTNEDKGMYDFYINVLYKEFADYSTVVGQLVSITVTVLFIYEDYLSYILTNPNYSEGDSTESRMLDGIKRSTNEREMKFNESKKFKLVNFNEYERFLKVNEITYYFTGSHAYENLQDIVVTMNRLVAEFVRSSNTKQEEDLKKIVEQIGNNKLFATKHENQAVENKRKEILKNIKDFQADIVKPNKELTSYTKALIDFNETGHRLAIKIANLYDK